MATICTLASGSSGNCTLLSDGRRHILIDMGISYRAAVSALGEMSLTAADISAIIVTHAHSDHIRGLQTISKRQGVPIYATEETAQAISGQFVEAERYITAIRPDGYFCAGGFDILPFGTSHDSVGSVGFRIETGGGPLGLMTDLGYVSNTVMEALTGVSTVILEANHDLDMLINGGYPYFLKRRILSDMGHLSNEASAEAAAQLAQAGCRKFVLAHLSRDNNTPEKARRAVSEALCDYDASLTVAPPGMGEVIPL